MTKQILFISTYVHPCIKKNNITYFSKKIIAIKHAIDPVDSTLAKSFKKLSSINNKTNRKMIKLI